MAQKVCRSDRNQQREKYWVDIVGLYTNVVKVYGKEPDRNVEGFAGYFMSMNLRK